MQVFRTPSLTAVSGQTASKSSALVTTLPACVTREASTAKGLGGSGTNWSPRHKQLVAGSSRNGPKHQDGVGSMPLLLWTDDRLTRRSRTDRMLTRYEPYR